MRSASMQETVQTQYKTAGRLNTRISIHDKYSTNQQGFGNWIFSHYRFYQGIRVLELGCGTGSMWLEKDEMIRYCNPLILSDLSNGMLATATETLKKYDTIVFREIDIENIPYPPDSFDAVIANMMLYHVPDIDKGLSEVRRVLRKDGRFYCATYGENGILPYLCSLFGFPVEESGINQTFTLQNGRETLLHHFGSVTRYDYPDSLAVTDVEDMVDYIYSLSGMAPLRVLSRDKVRSVLQNNMVDGVLSVPKEYGMFIAEQKN